MTWVGESENFYQYSMGNMILENNMGMTEKF